MESFVESLWTNTAWHSLGLSFAALWGLVSLRCLAMLWTMPVFGDPAVPNRLRILLAGSLGLVVAPIIVPQAVDLEISFAGLLPSVCSQILIGAAIGFSIRLLLSGLVVSATLIDRQSGLGLVQVVHPELSDFGSPSIQFFTVLGAFALLSGAPVSADLKMIESLLRSFESIPVVQSISPSGPTELLTDVLLQSLVLGMQVAAPVVVTLGMLQCALGFAQRSRFAGVSMASALPVQLGVGLLVLAFTVGDMLWHVQSVTERVIGSVASASQPSSDEVRP